MILPLMTALAILQPAVPAPPVHASVPIHSAASAHRRGVARIVVLKSQRELQLLSGDTVIRTYKVALGLEPVLPKVKQGDYATPEGNYFVCSKNPQSKYEFALGLSYPCPNDAERGLSEGLITNADHDRIIAAFVKRMAPPMNTPLGGEVMIHGKGSSWDWTSGCIALDHQDIEELFRSVPIGTPVTILP
jgi:murein L,D-transpeptidase YafK